MKRLLIYVTLLTGLAFGTSSFAHEAKMARPHDFDREIEQYEDTLFSLPLEEGETADFSANGVKRVTIDETRIVDIRPVDGRLVLRAKTAGKAVVRLHFADATTTTLIVRVNLDTEACSEQ